MAAIARRRSRDAEAFSRPAELVEVSERVYRQVFAAGLWVAVACVAYAGLSSLLQPTHGQPRASIACALCMPAAVLAATRPAQLYGLIRLRPWLLLVPAAVLGACAMFAGIHSYELFVPIVTVIGSIGVVAPARVVAAAGLVAAVAVAAPQITEGRGDVGGAIAIIVPPLMYWLIVDRIAGFALRLHQILGSASGDPALRAPAGYEPTADEAARSREDAQRALPAPNAITVDGKRLTSRQLQVLLLACEGLRHAEIGACLGIGPQQVRRHLRDARERAGADSTPQLVAWARRSGLVPQPHPQH